MLGEDGNQSNACWVENARAHDRRPVEESPSPA
jgi:hypothetical protein